MSEERDRRIIEETNYTGWRAQSGWRPTFLERARGSTFWDSDGRAYLDFASQLVSANLGHGNERVGAAIAYQATTLPYAGPGFGTEIRARASEALGRVLPKGLRRYFFSTSGTDANEAALRMARVATGRSRILALDHSYHGATAGSLSVSGDLRRTAAGPSSEVPGTEFVPACYCYRCPLGLTYPDCRVACADKVTESLEAHDDVAAMIVEPVVGTNGVIVPVAEWLPKIRAATRRRGVLLIADEVMTGSGRTGAWFAVDRYGVEPDILTTAKGITGGYAPLGLTATSSQLYDRFADRYLPVGHTYEAHPIGLAAAVAALSEYERLSLIPKARADGEYLLERLREIGARHRSVGEVRGLGLFAGVELVSDPVRRTPFNTDRDKLEGRRLMVDEVLARLASDGVYAYGWVNHLVIAPPLIVTRPELDRGLDALDRALEVSDARVSAA